VNSIVRTEEKNVVEKK